MMLREIEHLNFPSRESTLLHGMDRSPSIVNQGGISFGMVFSKIIALKFLIMIVSIVLNKKPDKFLTSSSSSSVKIHFKVNCDVLVCNYLKFFM